MVSNKVDISPFRTGGYYETYENAIPDFHRIIGLHLYLFISK